nr:ribonuclease H-like domain-containing protein [Tanacetum cinerariifolium]
MSDDDSLVNSVHEEDAPEQKVTPPPQITTVTSLSTKFPYLKKDTEGNIIIAPHVTIEEHMQVQREEKARTMLLTALPDEHMGDFYHMIDAKQIWSAIKARFGGNAESTRMRRSLLKHQFKEYKSSEEEGLDGGYDKMQKILSKMNTLKIKPDQEDINMKFLRGLPPSWANIAQIKEPVSYVPADSNSFVSADTTYLRSEITNFLQKSNETFNEAWERFKDLLRQCPHHGFLELHQLDTFYNALNPNDQDALDSAADGNFLDKIPRECLSIIESKSKVRYSRSRVTDVRENANAPLSSSSHSNSFDLQQISAALEDKLDIRMNRFEKSLNEMKISLVTPTSPLKAVTEVCVTCGSNHSYNQCPLTRGRNDFLVFHDNIQQF